MSTHGFAFIRNPTCRFEMIKVVIFDIGNTLVSQDTGLAFPHAVEVLEELRERYRLAAITNYPVRSDC